MFENFSFAILKKWAVDRLAERSSWNGFVIIAICVAILFAAPFIHFIAYAGIAYGLYTVIKKELS